MEKIIKNLLYSLPGVIGAARVRKEDLPGILKEETIYEGGIKLIKLVNLGIRKIMLCKYVFVFLKDEKFRRPPCPTVYLVEESGRDGGPGKKPMFNRVKSGNRETEYFEIDGQSYHIVGEEVIDENKEYREKTAYLDKGFVIFPERRQKTKNVPAFFLIPPIPFPELDSLRESHDIGNVISVSPSSKCDDFLREKYNLSTCPENATILIGVEA